MVLAKLPTIAMPKAAPNSRLTSFAAEPTPASFTGTAAMTVSVSGAIDMPAPIPNVNSEIAICSVLVSTSRRRKRSSPAIIDVMAPSRSRRGPMRFTSRPAIGAPTIMPAAGMTISRPASNALRPWTSWKNWVRKKNVTNSAKKISPMMITPPVKSFWRKSCSGSIGSAERSSTTAKAVSNAAAATNDPTISVDVHPASVP